MCVEEELSHTQRKYHVSAVRGSSSFLFLGNLAKMVQVLVYGSVCVSEAFSKIKSK